MSQPLKYNLYLDNRVLYCRALVIRRTMPDWEHEL